VKMKRAALRNAALWFDGGVPERLNGGDSKSPRVSCHPQGFKALPHRQNIQLSGEPMFL
jgi:hypothetical protein